MKNELLTHFPEQLNPASKFPGQGYHQLSYLSGGKSYPATNEGYAQMRRDEHRKYQPTVKFTKSIFPKLPKSVK